MVPVSQTEEKEEEEFFEHFMELPPELRMVIVNAMRPEDRCRFARSSKVSNAEAISSKNYVHGLVINIESRDHIEIAVEHRRYEGKIYNDDTEIFEENPNDKRRGFCLIFKREPNGQTFLRYSTHGEEKVELRVEEIELSMEKYPSELEISEKLYRMAINRFKKYASLHKTKIKRLTINSKIDRDIDINDEIRNMRKLESLCIEGKIDYTKFITQIQHPLKKIEVYGKDVKVTEQIFQCLECIEMSGLELTCEQLDRIFAEDFSIHIGQISAKELYKFVTTWYDGPDERTRLLYFRLEDSGFDTGRFLRFFGHEWNGGCANGSVEKTKERVKKIINFAASSGLLSLALIRF